MSEKKVKKEKKEEVVADADAAEMFGEKKKKKKKEASDDEGEKAPVKEKKEKKEKKQRMKPTPLICQVKSISSVPKKDNLRVCEVYFMDGQENVNIVTNAPNVCVAGKFIVALSGVTTASGIQVEEKPVGGVESFGMFCGPEEMCWDTDILDSKLAIILDDSAEVGTIPTYEDAVQAFQDRKKSEAAKAAAAAAKADAKGKKGKKGKADADEEEDLDALLAEAGMEVKEEAPSAKKKGKKGKADAKKQDDDDDDAFLEGFTAKEEPKVEAKPAEEAEAPDGEVDAKTLANRKKKDKKKASAKGGDGGADDDDAAMDEFKVEAPAAVEKAEAEPAAVEKADAGAPEGVVEDAKTIANRKKKEKEKAKKEAARKAVGGGFFGGDDPDDAAATLAAEGADSQAAPAEAVKAPEPAAKKGAPPKKESAAVKAARERMEAQKALDEEKAAFDLGEKTRIEEEERIEREEEEKLEADRKRKRDARQAKIEKQKADGTFQTKNQKLKAERAKQLREQFGFVMEGDDDGEEKDADAKPAPKKSTLATKKKKNKAQQKEESEDDAPAPEADKGKSPAAKAKADKKAEASKDAEDADDGDDWEAADEKREQEEAAKAEAAAAKKAAGGGSDEEDSGSDSDSSSDSDSDSDDFNGYRSPIICIMGHVDTGKTKLLDKIRRTNVQEGEAGGITQQIGATFFPDIALEEQTKKVNPNFELELPGLLIIDTPGHESFNNLRKRGSSLCDFAIVVIDIMHGLEPQTVESLDMLRKRQCPFIIALNKIDVCYQWQSENYTSIRHSLPKQNESVQAEFKDRFQNVMLQLNQKGLNCALYWENQDIKSTVSIVPTSALTGEGVPDLLYCLLNLSQQLMASALEVSSDLQCSVIEVKNIEGHGTTIDVVLINGVLHEGDQIVIAGMGGPIVTTIRALLTPAPMKEMRVKGEYVHHAKIDVSMGVKISAPGLEDAVAGCELKVIGPDDDLDELKEEVQEGFDSILDSFEKQTSGVYVKTSTLGSLEALLSFLEESKIPVFDVGIGEVSKKDVKRATIMKEKGHPEYAVILAFDIKVSNEAQLLATKEGVEIMTADIIYHLFDRFTQYMKKIQDARKVETKQDAVFPVAMEIQKQFIIRQKDPIILGVKIVGGQLRVGTPICLPEKDFLEIGRIGSIERDHKDVKTARRGDNVCIKIEQSTAQNHITYGRHFDFNNKLYSKISRNSIDTLKEHFKDEMKKEDWELIIGMKTLFKIM